MRMKTSPFWMVVVCGWCGRKGVGGGEMDWKSSLDFGIDDAGIGYGYPKSSISFLGVSSFSSPMLQKFLILLGR